MARPTQSRKYLDFSMGAFIYKVGYTHNPDGTKVSYRYNDKGELAEVTDAAPTAAPSPVATYTRNAEGQITEVKFPNGVATRKNYDAAGRLAEISHVAKDGTILFVEASHYDQRDRRTARVKGDGTADLFAYDPAGQVIAAAYGRAGVPPATSPAGVPPAATQNPNATSAGGTPAGQTAGGTPVLPFAPQQTFSYDPAGNRKAFQDLDGTKTDYQTNEANQYTEITANGEQGTENNAPAYDPNGNLLKDPNNTYTWDADIHLLSVETKSSIKDQASSITKFRYDPLHRRVARLESNGELTHFVHDGWNVLAEYQAQPRTENGEPGTKAAHPSSFILHTSLIWGEDLSRSLQGAGGIGGLIKTISPKAKKEKSTTSLFHYDSNGNVVLLTALDASISARYAYDAFGKTTTATGEDAESNRYRFSTKPVENGSGLAFYGFRYYSPQLGRWTARDPSTVKDRDLFLYRFATNNGVTDRDLLGLLSCVEEWAALGSLAPNYTCCGETLVRLFDEGVYDNSILGSASRPTFQGVCCGGQWKTGAQLGDGCCSSDVWQTKVTLAASQGLTIDQCAGGESNGCLTRVGAGFGLTGIATTVGAYSPLAPLKACCVVVGAFGSVVGTAASADWIAAKQRCEGMVCPP